VTAPLLDRIMERVDRQPDGCWLWTAGRTRGGYPTFAPRHGESRLVHRLAYELLVGPIPEGLTLDHLCKRPLCVNPEHLEPVTQRENLMRSRQDTYVAHRNGTCTKGHPESELYRRKSNGQVAYCRACARQKAAA
jgi:hypothetical protein